MFIPEKENQERRLKMLRDKHSQEKTPTHDESTWDLKSEMIWEPSNRLLTSISSDAGGREGRGWRVQKGEQSLALVLAMPLH